MEELPQDILIDIFSRLPVKALLRSKCVSKHWCNIIDRRCLANMHLRRATEEPSLLLIARSIAEPDVTSLYSIKEDTGTHKASYHAMVRLENSRKYGPWGSCNGLLCFARHDDGLVCFPKPYKRELVFVCNPLRGEVITLPAITTPSPSPFGSKYGLGFDPSTEQYKVVRIFFRVFDSIRDFYSLGAEIHTLGSKSWREIHNSPPYPIQGNPVFAKGVLHWKINSQLCHNKTENMILSFDIGNEEFSLTPHPEGLEFYDMVSLVELRGSLSLVDSSSNEHIVVWVLKDYIKKQWVREHCIGIRAPEGWFNNGHIKVVGLWEHDEILLTLWEDSLFSYDPKTDKLRYVHISANAPDVVRSEIYAHTGSLVLLKAYDQ